MPYTLKGTSQDGGVHEESFDSLTAAITAYNQTAGARVLDPIALISEDGHVMHNFGDKEVPASWSKKKPARAAE